MKNKRKISTIFTLAAEIVAASDDNPCKGSCTSIRDAAAVLGYSEGMATDCIRYMENNFRDTTYLYWYSASQDTGYQPEFNASTPLGMLGRSLMLLLLAEMVLEEK